MPSQDDRKYQVYVQSVIDALEKDPEKLTDQEKRLGTKYQETLGRFNQVARDIEQIKRNIVQAEAQLRSLELQAADAQGKASGFLESLIGEKFPETVVIPPPPPSPPKVSPPKNSNNKRRSR